MRSRYRVGESLFAHFVTGTFVEWLPLFESVECRNILVESLLYCREHKGLRIYSWVILNNHFHAIVAAEDLSAVMRDLRKFTAKRLLEHLETHGPKWLLQLTREHRLRHKLNSTYQIWQESFHPQEISDDEMMAQKIWYIECNPVERGWVLDPYHWRYSSAHERLPGVVPLFHCDPWR